MQPEVARALARSRASDPLDVGDVAAVLRSTPDDLAVVLERARELRDEGLSARRLDGIVTYSRKVFIPLTKLCRYRCSYCTFVTPRVEPGGEYLTVEQVLEIAAAGREWGCTEALFTLGEAPEARHPEAQGWLSERGLASTVDYLIHAAGEVVMRTGLLPHANPGAVTVDEMRRLRDVTASQGLMMEQLSDRLLAPGQAHAGAAGKAAGIRLEQLSFASQTNTPYTTGLLVGIGETLDERAATILAIRDAQRGQLQETIVQNFRAKPDTPMRGHADAEVDEMLRAIAATRLALGSLASVQAPPNLTPDGYSVYLDAGVNDWGGVSPLTPDHVNPEMPWPTIDRLAESCERHGFTLRQRLPVYPEYLTSDAIDTWIAKPMRRHVLALSDGMGLAREDRWHAGEGWVPVHRAAQPVPKRRALAIASSKPDLRAEDVFAEYGNGAQTAGCGDAGGNGHLGFDEMLPDVASRFVLPHERADLASAAALEDGLGPNRLERDGLASAAALGDGLGPNRLDRDRGGEKPPPIPPQEHPRKAVHGWIAPFVLASGRVGAGVRSLLSKGSQGERLSEAEVERLFRAEGADLGALISTADAIRREMNGDEVTYVVNRNITYTNFCHTGCGFCGFARPTGHEDGYYFDPETVGRKALEAWQLGATEVCIQGGIHPSNDGRIYVEIARAVKAAAPGIHLHGFSPLEVTVGARTLNLPLAEYLPMLRESGLDSMPGTAAEILDSHVRHKITPEKLTADDWTEVMTVAHATGVRATTTIMFGHVDYPAAWARHILRLRDIQTRTGGFTEFVPLPFVHHRTPIFMRGESRTGPTWRECVKIHAVARIALHPVIPNIQGSWVKLGVEGVVAMLDAGVNDFGGTLMEEHISRMAGASHGLGLTVDQIESAIRRAGRVPRERTTLYGRPSVPYRDRVAALTSSR